MLNPAIDLIDGSCHDKGHLLIAPIWCVYYRVGGVIIQSVVRDSVPEMSCSLLNP